MIMGQGWKRLERMSCPEKVPKGLSTPLWIEHYFSCDKCCVLGHNMQNQKSNQGPETHNAFTYHQNTSSPGRKFLLKGIIKEGRKGSMSYHSSSTHKSQYYLLMCLHQIKGYSKVLKVLKVLEFRSYPMFISIKYEGK